MIKRGRVRRARVAVVVGLVSLAGVVGVFAPPVHRLEESLGLGLLFRVRGPRRPPADVVIVSIDAEVARRLNLPERPDKWSRALHARLLGRLAQAGAAAVAFDLTFDQPQPGEGDRAFADAIRESGNVVLCEYLRQRNLPLPAAGGTGVARVETVVPPIPALAAFAATAPFPLPKAPTRVSRYWKFKSGSGDQPTMPVVLLALFARPVQERFLALLGEVDAGAASRVAAASTGVNTAAGAAQVVRAMRDLTAADPSLPGRMLARLTRDDRGPQGRERQLLAALIGLYLDDETPYLDLFGPAGTVTTVPYDAVLAGAAGVELRGKAVLVGLSERTRAEQRDNFPTVFSGADGIDLNGVEIAATAFSNLLERRAVRAPDARTLIPALLLWGMIVGTACSLLSPRAAALVVAALSAAWCAAAAAWFGAAAVWVPLVVPLLLQAPLAWIAALLWRYREEKRGRGALAAAFGHYLPAHVVEELSARLREPGGGGGTVYGVCLFTDIAGYTDLAETMDPDRLRGMLNDYFGVLSAKVAEHGGRVSDVVGDAMLAIWVSPRPDAAIAASACRAAAAMDAAVNRPERRGERTALPTRIGVHAGYVSLGDVGAGTHFEYTPIGDIVNTASRIEGLNKKLGTRVLASFELREGWEGLSAREVGSFLLAGKTRPVLLAELLGPVDQIGENRLLLCTAFAAALESFRGGNWSEAVRRFRRCLEIDGGDGVSRFYLARCEQYLLAPPEGDWKGMVNVHEK